MRKYCVIGRPLGHTVSPFLHSRLFAMKGAEAEYTARPVEALSAEIDALRNDYDGFNVTIPYKRDIIGYLDGVDEGAKSIGAVNTVVKDGGKRLGRNTDIDGFAASLDRSGVDAKGAKCLIVGYGGVAKPIAYALLGRGADVFVTGRNPSKAQEFADFYGKGRMRLYDGSVNADIVVNATPVGMYPDVADRAIDIYGCGSLRYYFDTIYNPRVTASMRDCRKAGIRCADGLYMLVVQAGVAQRHWLGHDFTREEYESVAREVAGYMANKKVGGADIVLTGFMGSGKSSVGRKLAETTGREFVDTDEEIEKRYGSIKDIFDNEGERAFRAKEAEVFASCLKGGRVISTGGGLVCSGDNARLMKERDCVNVYLECDFGVLKARAANSGRPLFRDSDRAYALYLARKNIYGRCADVTVDGGGSIEATVDYILAELG